MKQIDLIIQNRTGLHARPARVLVDTAKQFTSAVRLRHGAKAANAKSLISVLALGVTSGGAVVLEVDGADEDLAADTLCAAVADGLGEGAHTKVPAPSAPAPASPSAVGELHGVAAAPGIAIGPTFRLRRAAVQVHDYSSGATLESERLRRALADAAGQLVALREQVLQRAGPEEAAIFDVHHELIADAELHADVFARIDAGQSAAAAWHAATVAAADVMAALPDPTLAGRAADLRDAGERVLRLLSGDAAPSAELPPEPVILLAYDLSPSETAALDPQRVLGFCTAVGGPNAHAAILARALGLPAIVSAGPAILDLEDGTPAILDGATGSLLTRPGRDAMDEARDRQRRATDARRAALESAATPAITTDGHRVEVAANIGSAEDARRAVESGAEAVGLLRSEFLFLDREQAPSEAEQRAVYAEILAAMGGRPVVLRTLDIGGDKPLPYLSLPAEENPFLGERGIRLCQAHPYLLEQQLRAALSAASSGELRIMFPMVSDIAELRAARAAVERIRAELGAPAVQVGIMVEVPSAALMADALAAECDFFSVGTNDLTQYTMAIDRTHPTLAARADGLHPAVLRLIDLTVKAAHAAGRWVGVCGELGADPVAVPILIGLGVDELSVSAPAIPSVKAQVRDLSMEQCKERARAALACATASEVRSKM
ncbi:phosphoenolpyruvate--protein phosphotransferase [Chloroflexales bacterium ZM16-3]|nr:phosphoenolpyruvate--protein phosphotransferase [Chloroflexales bacterium ZM16-3]